LLYTIGIQRTRSSCQNHLTPSLADLQLVERRRYRRFRPSQSRHDVVSNARLPLDPPADNLSLGQAEFSMDGIWGITFRKFLRCIVGFREFWCTVASNRRLAQIMGGHGGVTTSGELFGIHASSLFAQYDHKLTTS